MSNKNVLTTIYNELSQEISADAIQSKDFGAKTDGYIIGYLIERLNETLIPKGCSWHMESIPIKLATGECVDYIKETTMGNNNKEKETITVRYKVDLRGPDGEILDSKESWGGCGYINNSLGDTLKGAQTDALKKIFSYFGLGNTAFKGKIQEQLRSVRYETNVMLNDIAETLKKEYNIEIKDSVLLRYLSSALSKDFDDLEDIKFSDIKKAYEICKKSFTEEVTNETETNKKRTSRDNKEEANKPELDIPDNEEDVPPF